MVCTCLRVCAYFCMCVRACVRASVFACVYVLVCACICKHARVYVCTCLCLCASACMCRQYSRRSDNDLMTSESMKSRFSLPADAARSRRLELSPISNEPSERACVDYRQKEKTAVICLHLRSRRADNISLAISAHTCDADDEYAFELA